MVIVLTSPCVHFTFNYSITSSVSQGEMTV